MIRVSSSLQPPLLQMPDLLTPCGASYFVSSLKALFRYLAYGVFRDAMLCLYTAAVGPPVLPDLFPAQTAAAYCGGCLNADVAGNRMLRETGCYGKQDAAADRMLRQM